MLGKLRQSQKWRKFVDGGNLLTVLTVLAVGLGIALGLGLREVKKNWTAREVIYLRFPGDLFLRTLSALILPLIVSSLVDSIGSLDLSLSKKIGTRALVYYLATTAVAAILGIILGITVQPGTRSNIIPGDECVAPQTSTIDTLLDLVRNLFPNNLVGATMQISETKVRGNDSTPFGERPIEIAMMPGTNMLGLVAFSMVLGLTLGAMKEAGRPLLEFFRSLGDATMIITSRVVSFSPVAIFFLVASQLVEQKNIEDVFKNMAWYFATVLIGLALHGIILLPLLYFIFTRRSPLPFIGNMFQSLATAFGTASSSATLPVTMRCLEEKNKIDLRVSRFVIPIGATVNMNGTAIYLPIGAIFIAQLCGIQLGIGQLVAISLISIATSIGAAGIPQVGMIIMITVLSSVGLPPSYLRFIYPIDWLLERFRTVVNVLGDAIGAGIVAGMSKRDLEKDAMADGDDFPFTKEKPSSQELTV